MKKLCKNCIHYYKSYKGDDTCQNRYIDSLFIDPNDSCNLFILNIELLITLKEINRIYKY